MDSEGTVLSANEYGLLRDIPAKEENGDEAFS